MTIYWFVFIELLLHFAFQLNTRRVRVRQLKKLNLSNNYEEENSKLLYVGPKLLFAFLRNVSV